MLEEVALVGLKRAVSGPFVAAACGESAEGLLFDLAFSDEEADEARGVIGEVERSGGLLDDEEEADDSLDAAVATLMAGAAVAAGVRLSSPPLFVGVVIGEDDAEPRR